MRRPDWFTLICCVCHCWWRASISPLDERFDITNRVCPNCVPRHLGRML